MDAKTGEVTPLNRVGHRRSSGRGFSFDIATAAIVVGAFALYWFSSTLLVARYGADHFGADSWAYSMLAQGNVWTNVGVDPHLGRIVRFHPVTVALAAAWVELFQPVADWISPKYVLKALFAAVGAAGVWAAISAFAAVMPRRHALLFGMIYAVSLGVWYFSSIEESKIVTASLTAAYIAVYLKVRDNWTISGVLALTVILAVACLNEIVSAFLVVIPAIDVLLRSRWKLSKLYWVVAHALVAPIALIILELIFNKRVSAEVVDDEGMSHVGMLLHYMLKNAHGWPEIHAFLSNWLFFNLAAPTRTASYGVPPEEFYKGYFSPELANYLQSPATMILGMVLAAMLAAVALPRFRGRLSPGMPSLLAGLAAFTLVRGTFFFIFNPPEPLLFSPSVTLAHLLIVGVPFTASTFPAKSLVLAVAAAGLLVTNGTFIVGIPPAG